MPIRKAHELFGDGSWHPQMAAELDGEGLAVPVQDVVIATAPVLRQFCRQVNHLLRGQVGGTQVNHLSLVWHAAGMHPLQSLGAI